MKPTYFAGSKFYRSTALAAIALLGCVLAPSAFANETAAAHAAPAPAANAPLRAAAEPVAAKAQPADSEKPPRPDNTISRLKAVIEQHSGKGGSVSLRVGGHVIAAADSHSPTPALANDRRGESMQRPRKAKASAPVSRHEHSRARAAVLSGHAAPEAHTPAGSGHAEPHWEHEGENGPQNWANLKPEFSTCATGKRQSPVHILEADTVAGPAEVLQFDYKPSGGSIVNNGHTVQVDLAGNNVLYVRGSAYKLIQFHFHHPSEERVNYKGFAMVAHLVHKNEEGQLAKVAVLIDPGAENPLIEQLLARMPLDVKDRVGFPAGLIDMNQLLPTDQRYYQFIGSLTTPPCTEGVLWLVMKQPMTVSREQLKLFTKLYPMNARPVQALNGRLVREGM
ncbi:MAG: carbonic anhydrase family protein [Hydrogenophaga sp.]